MRLGSAGLGRFFLGRAQRVAAATNYGPPKFSTTVACRITFTSSSEVRL